MAPPPPPPPPQHVTFRAGGRWGQTSQFQAQKQYQDLDLASRIEVSSPAELVSLLYDELATALGVMRSALAADRRETAKVQAERARTVLLSLMASLDFERGGDLARNLANVYHAMLSSLSRAEKGRDLKGLDELIGGLENVRASWQQISASGQALQGGPPAP